MTQTTITFSHFLSTDTHFINDIISNNPEISEDKYLILQSDNCQDQYKCKYMFHQIKELAINFNITVAWFYGEAGHRKRFRC